jgi:hypothetical protein
MRSKTIAVYLVPLIVIGVLLVSCQETAEWPSEVGSQNWYRGNLHTHSFWSDGDDFPESILAWYTDRAYDFVAISDHNTFADSERWLRFDTTNARYQAYQIYRKRFGDDWVDAREENDSVFVRLKTYEEYSGRFSVSNKFLVIRSEEISDGYDGKPVHVNATNLRERIEPHGGSSVFDVMQRNVRAVLEKRAETGQPMLPHINNPNFGWAVTAEDLARLEGERFIEVYNGHPAVRNEGDSSRPSVEMMWDIANSLRVSENLPLLFGLAVDDAHNFHDFARNRSNPGRGWVMVHADSLAAGEIIQSMEKGDFYASSGVEVANIESNDLGILVEIAGEEGVTYKTEFIGARRQERDARQGAERDPDEIGIILDVVHGTFARYEFQGDELYVRARITSSALKENPYRGGEHERAWTQPVLSPSFNNTE